MFNVAMYYYCQRRRRKSGYPCSSAQGTILTVGCGIRIHEISKCGVEEVSRVRSACLTTRRTVHDQFRWSTNDGNICEDGRQGSTNEICRWRDVIHRILPDH